MSSKDNEYDVIMVGAGPAALTAGIYTSRENIKTLIIEKGVIGGLAAITDQIDNYPGFADGVEGLKLASELRKQAERFGAKIELDEVIAIENHDKFKVIKTHSGELKAKAVLIASGSDYVKLGIPGETEMYGRGVHYCATCDGAFYNDKRIVTVGAGNSAAQESLFLTRFAKHIDVLIRGDKWKASDVLIDEINKNQKIEVHFNITTEEIIVEDNKVVKVRGHDKSADKDVFFDADGVFPFVGLKPNTQFLKGSNIMCDEHGFVLSNDHLETNEKGIFVAGDVRSGATMQIASAAGEGATAALHIREYLEH
jgi:thioredoxin reductase (NADPH)